MSRRLDKRSAETLARYRPAASQRRSIRLKGHDYTSSGAYFLTVCTAGRKPLFGHVSGGRMVENRSAGIVWECWESLPDHYPRVSLDAFVVMPDHVHGVVVLGGARPVDVCGRDVARAGFEPAPTGGGALEDAGVWHGLPEVVRALKTFSARRINVSRGTPGAPVWQRGYYERIIRDGNALKNVRQYIRTNPQRHHNPPAHPTT